MAPNWFALSIFVLNALRVYCNSNGSEEGHCITRGICQTTLIHGNIPCVYEGPPKLLTGRKYTTILNDLCPDFDAATPLCCDEAELDNLKTAIAMLRGVGLGRCSSCIHNFMRMLCHLACSTRQSTFHTVDGSKIYRGKTTVTETSFYISSKFAHGMFESCKGIQGIQPGTTVVGLLCGAWAKDCNAQRWLESIGNSVQKRGHSPYQINFILSPYSEHEHDGKTFHPLKLPFTKCSEPPGPNSSACSCNDCEESCSTSFEDFPTLPVAENPLDFYELDGYLVLLFGAFLVAVIVAKMALCLWYKRKNPKASVETIQLEQNVSPDTKRGPNLGILEDVNPLRPQYLHVHEIPDQKCANLLTDSGESDHAFSQGGNLRVGGRPSVRMERALQAFFQRIGLSVSHHPLKTIFLSLAVSLALSSGLLYRFQVITDPVQLWVSPHSQSFKDMKYFNDHFDPFYRIEHVIITSTNKSSFRHPVFIDGEEVEVNWGPIFRQDFMLEVFSLQQQMEHLEAKRGNRTIRLKDICLMPLHPIRSECAIQSVFSLYQNDLNKLTNASYLSHFKNCSKGHTDMKCFAPYGGPLDSIEVVLGGFEGEDYSGSTSFIIVIPVKNYNSRQMNEDAIAWEEEFIRFMKNYSNPRMEIAFRAERSVEDELERSSRSDIVTVGISYLVMFVYISIALGEINSCKYFLENSKIVLGLFGVLIILVSIVSSLGIFCFLEIHATLLIFEVIPFLVLAVGVDNIFILVQTFQRDNKKPSETLEVQIGRVVGEVAPTMMLSSLSMSSCFFIGTLIDMPAVKIFALYAGVALLINFFLQMTCFLGVFTLDAKREQDRRADFCCCVKIGKGKPKPPKTGRILSKFITYFVVPVLKKNPVRFCVIVAFFGWLASSIAVISKIDIGFDQNLILPEDSYMIKYFDFLDKYLSVGPPVYFVITDGYNYSNPVAQKRICSRVGCDSDSVMSLLRYASIMKNKTYIALKPVDWLDSFFDFMDTESCCYHFPNGSHCPSATYSPYSTCEPCNLKYRPIQSPDDFAERVHYFLQDIPGPFCPKAGKAMFESAVQMVDEGGRRRIGATNIMTYHTTLKTSKDFFESLRWARIVSQWLTDTINKNTSANVTVFPYSIAHVFYEQYLTTWPDTLRSLSLSVAAVFVVTFLLLGLDLHSAVIVAGTILMIIIDLMGLMYWWDISLNAVSLVNLVVGVGISVEFCSHLTRYFVFSQGLSRTDRAMDALQNMGSSIVYGITLTDCGILVLAFAKSGIFQVFYFRMYLGIIAFGTVHSIIFLPVLLSLVGPSRSSRN